MVPTRWADAAGLPARAVRGQVRGHPPRRHPEPVVKGRNVNVRSGSVRTRRERGGPACRGGAPRNRPPGAGPGPFRARQGLAGPRTTLVRPRPAWPNGRSRGPAGPPAAPAAPVASGAVCVPCAGTRSAVSATCRRPSPSAPSSPSIGSAAAPVTGGGPAGAATRWRARRQRPVLDGVACVGTVPHPVHRGAHQRRPARPTAGRRPDPSFPADGLGTEDGPVGRSGGGPALRPGPAVRLPGAPRRAADTLREACTGRPGAYDLG